jgi:uncharacterized protein YeeX (DUF496 family)
MSDEQLLDLLAYLRLLPSKQKAKFAIADQGRKARRKRIKILLNKIDK